VKRPSKKKRKERKPRWAAELDDLRAKLQRALTNLDARIERLEPLPVLTKLQQRVDYLNDRVERLEKQIGRLHEIEATIKTLVANSPAEHKRNGILIPVYTPPPYKGGHKP